MEILREKDRRRKNQTAEKLAMMEEVERLRSEVVSLKVLFIFYG